MTDPLLIPEDETALFLSASEAEELLIALSAHRWESGRKSKEALARGERKQAQIYAHRVDIAETIHRKVELQCFGRPMAKGKR